MTPSEQRLHPASLLFDVAMHLKNFALPALLVILGFSQSPPGLERALGPWSGGWELWLLLPLVPAVLASLARYLSFRLRYAGTELVIRSGLLFRNERHVPFARIQNLDAVQNVFHRLLGVVEVRVETGGGQEEEARLRVLPRAAFDEMRRRVFEGHARQGPPAPALAGEAARREDGDASQPTAAAGVTLLHLPLRELLLCGFLENKGLVLIGAAYGAAWESGLFSGFWDRLFGASSYGRGFFRDLVAALFQGRVPLGPLAIALAGLLALLLFVRVVSMAWAFVRLYDFRLTRLREDLRTEFGLFTRVTATIPMGRVQTLTIREGPLHRWLGRASLRVETAGGSGSESAATREREWLAPLVRRRELPALLGQVLPGFRLDALAWLPVHPRALRRELKPRLLLAAAAGLGTAPLIGRAAGVVFALGLLWAYIDARQYVRHVRWAEGEEVVALRSGWLWRQLTLARTDKVQAVAVHESPFDRRASMASVRVDTAGAGEFSHRVHIPYLDRRQARQLADRLAAQAASTAFRW